MDTNKLELILGLEIHMQLKTNNKMFSYADGLAKQQTNYEKLANVHVDPVSLGLPGALPIANKDAIKLAQKLSYALTDNLNNYILFKRKNYSYPDLPKGYQITCPDDPISTGGELDMTYFRKETKIRFREIHLEEDTGKSIHKKSETLLDYNKSGLPLLEIVTEPDFRDIDLAVEFCKEVKRVAKALQVSDADLEKGNMRLEANISVRRIGQTELPEYRVELKNINSFNFMKKAINYEFDRQSKLILEGRETELAQETRGYNESTGKTFVQRSKEDAHDYRYFPDPDIPRIEFDQEWITEIKDSVKNRILPNQLRSELKAANLNEQFISVLVDNEELYNKYLNLKELKVDSKDAANYVVNVPEYNKLSAKDIIQKIREKESNKISDKEQLELLLKQVYKENPIEHEKYLDGDSKLKNFFIGKMMQKTNGKADISILNKIL